MIAHLLNAANLIPDIDGCYLYLINSDPNDPEGVWVYEVWRSQADHQASLTHDAVKALITSARPLIAEFGERFEITPVGGKGLPDGVMKGE